MMQYYMQQGERIKTLIFNIELAIMDCYGIEHNQNTIAKAGIFAARNNISDYSKKGINIFEITVYRCSGIQGNF